MSGTLREMSHSHGEGGIAGKCGGRGTEGHHGGVYVRLVHQGKRFPPAEVHERVTCLQKRCCGGRWLMAAWPWVVVMDSRD